MIKTSNIDTLFGKYRVSTIIDSSNTIVRNNKLSEMADWCAENTCQDGNNNMVTYSGVWEGEVVWCFDDEKDAILFALRWK